VRRLASTIRDERPDVIVTYDASYARGHPDHLRCYEAATRAFEETPREGQGPSKLYLTRTHSTGRLRAKHAWLDAESLPIPYAEAVTRVADDRPTTRTDVGDHLAEAREALRCHRSEVRREEPWFFAVSTDVMRLIYPWRSLSGRHRTSRCWSTGRVSSATC